jgi:hypothetical protein
METFWPGRSERTTAAADGPQHLTDDELEEQT